MSFSDWPSAIITPYPCWLFTTPIFPYRCYTHTPLLNKHHNIAMWPYLNITCACHQCSLPVQYRLALLNINHNIPSLPFPSLTYPIYYPSPVYPLPRYYHARDLISYSWFRSILRPFLYMSSNSQSLLHSLGVTTLQFPWRSIHRIIWLSFSFQLLFYFVCLTF